MESRSGFVRVEARENIDYVYVIHRQLDRIAQVRTSLFDRSEHDERYPGAADLMIGRALRYLTAVETLYFILHPSLRGNARELLANARRAASLVDEISELKEAERQLKEYHSEDAARELKEVREKIAKLKETLSSLLPPACKDMLAGRAYLYGEVVAYIADAALEEMLVKLNEAGLLLRAERIRVGVPGH